MEFFSTFSAESKSASNSEFFHTPHCIFEEKKISDYINIFANLKSNADETALKK
jgi:hypothetical protein